MIYYVSFENGNDTTGDGSAGNPWATYVKAKTVITDADEVRVEETSAQTTSSVASCTFTNDSDIVTTSASLVGIVAVGDFVGISTSEGNGEFETLYMVDTVTSTQLTLSLRYQGATVTDGTIRIVTPWYSSDKDPFVVTENSIVLSGGWNFSGTPARTGETWIRCTQPSSSAPVITVSNGSVVSYLNMVQGERGAYIHSGSELHNCSIYDMRYYYGCQANAGAVIHDCVFAGMQNNNPTYPALAVYGGDVKDCLIFSEYYAIRFNRGVDWTGNTNTVTSNSTAVNIYTSETITLGNLTIKNSLYGIRPYYPGIGVKGGLVKDCRYGIYTETLKSQGYYYDITFENCTSYAVYLRQSMGYIFEKCIFNNNYKDYYQDNYCSNTTMINCTHNNPTSYAYQKTIIGGTILIQGCTIDAGSIGRAINFGSNASYKNTPEYIIQDSFGFNGTYYTMGEVSESSTELSPITNSNTIKILFNTTMTSLHKDYKIASSYVGSGQGKRLSVYYKMPSTSWAGAFTLKAKLNGITITESAEVVTGTTSWLAVTLDVPSGSVTSTGELSLEINIIGNTYPIYFGDFTAVDL